MNLAATDMYHKKIVVADDDPLLRQLLRYKLAARGHSILLAQDGESAVIAVRAELPDLVVLDGMMPICDGFDVLRQLKADKTTAHIPVLMLTARNEESDVVDALRLGAADYLVKPFHPEELVVRIERLMFVPVLFTAAMTACAGNAAAQADGVDIRSPDAANARQEDLLLESSPEEGPVPPPGRSFEELFHEATTARHQGRAAEAVIVLTRLAEQMPDNADVQVQLGFALLGTDRLADAEAAFDRALALAPEYRDANLGLGLIAFRRGSFERAIEQAQLVLAARDDPEAGGLLDRARQAQAAAGPAVPDAGAALPERRWRLDADGMYSHLTGAFEDWTEGSVRLGYQWVPQTTVSAGIEVSDRFDLWDYYVYGRIDHRFDERVSGYVLLGGTPDADFRPTIAYAAGGAAVVRRSADMLATTSLTLDLAQAHYTDNRVETVSPGIVQHLFSGTAWVSARWINTFDRFAGHQAGYFIRGDWQATSDLLIYGGYADAPESDGGRTIQIRTLFAGASMKATERLTLRASLARERRSIGFDRDIFSVGFGLSF